MPTPLSFCGRAWAKSAICAFSLTPALTPSGISKLKLVTCGPRIFCQKAGGTRCRSRPVRLFYDIQFLQLILPDTRRQFCYKHSSEEKVPQFCKLCNYLPHVVLCILCILNANPGTRNWPWASLIANLSANV